MMSTEKNGAPIETVASLIREVIGEDWIEDIEIGMETSFNVDLELESIEFVALAEALQAHYGAEINFVDWIASMELDQIIELTVGDLVEFISQCNTLQPTE